MAKQLQTGFSAPVFEALEPRLLLSTGPVLQSLSFTPGQLITTDVTSITATFDQALDPLTVNEETVRLRNAGDDGQFDTADDTFAAPDSVSLASGDTQIVMTFASALVDGSYRFEILGMQELLYAASHQSPGLLGFNASMDQEFNPTVDTLPAIADVAMGDGVLYMLSTGWWDGATSNHQVYSLDLSTGTTSQLGFVSLPTGLTNTAASDNLTYDPDSGLLYVSAYNPSNTVTAFNLSTNLQQSVSISGVPASFGTTLWVGDELYVLGNSSSNTAGLYTWDPVTGSVAFRTTAILPSGNWSGADSTDAYKASDALAYDPANNILYAGSAGTNELVAIDLATHTQLANPTINGSLNIHDMVFVDGRLYVHDHSNYQSSEFLYWDPVSGDVTVMDTITKDGWSLGSGGAYTLGYGELGGMMSAIGEEFDGDSDGRDGGVYQAEFSVDVTAPQVVSTTPANGLGSDLVEEIVIEFSEPVDPATVGSITLEWAGTDQQFDTADDGSLVLSSYTLSPDGRTLTYDTGGPLTQDAYRYTIPGTITDIAGHSLEGGDLTIGFNVATAPQISSISVVDGDLINDNAPTIEIAFDQAMDPATLTPETILLWDAGGQQIAPDILSYDAETMTATASWTTPLPDGEYQLSVGGAMVIDAQAVYLDGNDYIRIADAIDFQTQDYTYEAWIWADSTPPERRVIELGRTGSVTGILLYYDGRISSHMEVAGGRHWASDPSVLAQGEWIHVAATYEHGGAGMTLYVGGVAVAFNSYNLYGPAQMTGDLDLLIGASPWSGGVQLWNGRIADVRVWDHARSLEDIQADMNRQLLGTEDGLVAYWNFANGDATDMTGNGHEGVLYGDPTFGEGVELEYAWLGVDNVIRSAKGVVLDGENTGSMPSGNGSMGGAWGSTFAIDTANLQVVKTTPQAGLTNAPGDAIAIEFDEAVDPATIGDLTLEKAGPDGQFGTGDDSTVVLSSFTVSTDGKTVTYEVSPALTDGSFRYTLASSGPSAIKDLAGNPLAGDVEVAFTLDNVPPQVVSISPTDGTFTNSDVTDVVVSFSEPMDQARFTEDNFGLVWTAPDSQTIQLITPDSIAFSPDATQMTMHFDSPLLDGEYELYLGSETEMLVAVSAGTDNEIVLFNLKDNSQVSLNVISGTANVYGATDAPGGMYLLDVSGGNSSTANIKFLNFATGQIADIGTVTNPGSGNYNDQADLAYDPASGIIYVNSGATGGISAFDPATGTDLGQVSAFSSLGVWDIVFGRETGLLYTLGGSSTLHSYDPVTETLTQLGTMPLRVGGFDGNVDDLAFDATRNYLYGASSWGGFEMGQFDLATNTGSGLSVSGPSLDQTDIAAADNYLYFLQYTSGQTANIYRIDPAAGTYITLGSVTLPSGNFNTRVDDLEVILTDGLADVAGNPLDGDSDGVPGGDVISTFTIDTIPPEVTATLPAEGTGDTSISEITIDFSEPINPASFVELQVFAYDFDGTPQGSLFAAYATWNGDNTSVTWTLAEALGDGHYGFVVPGSLVADPAGNLIDGDNNGTPGGDYVGAFNVAPAPRITSISIPDGGATSDDTPSIEITFDRAMDPATLSTETIFLLGTDFNKATPAIVTYDEATMTATASWDVLPDALYQLVVTGAGGFYQTAAHFDGSTYIKSPLNIPETNLTYEMRFRTTVSNTGLFSVTGSGYDRVLYMVNGKLRNRVYSEETIESSGTYNDGQWHHVAITLGPDGHKMYVDGNLVASGTKTASNFTSDSHVLFGNAWGAPSPYMTGDMDEFRIWNVVRTQSEIQEFMNVGLEMSVPGLLGRWGFDDESISESNDNVDDGTIIGTLSYTQDAWLELPFSGVAIRSAKGVQLDGENTGPLPSGDGQSGGSWLSTFTIDATGPRVVEMGPVQPGDGWDHVQELTFQFNEPIDPDDVFPGKIAVVASGNDGIFGNENDIGDTPFYMTLSEDGQTLTLAFDVELPEDTYRITFLGSEDGITDPLGNPLDGEYLGSFPTGDGVAGGNFQIEFEVSPAPRAVGMIPEVNSGIYEITDDTITLTFDRDMDPASFTADTVKAFWSGPNDQTENGAGDDVQLSIGSMLYNAGTRELTLTITSPESAGTNYVWLASLGNTSQAAVQAIYLDGVDYIQVADSLDFKTEDYTYEAWAWADETGWQRVIEYGRQSQKVSILRNDNSNAMAMLHDFGSDNWVNASENMVMGGWVHYAATYDHSGEGMKFYVNGQLLGTNSYNSGGPAQLTGEIDLLIGGSHYFTSTDVWGGRIAEVRVWDHVRSIDDIQADMNRQLLGTEDGLVAYWNFANGDATDMTGNGHDGVLYGDPTFGEGVELALPSFDNVIRSIQGVPLDGELIDGALPTGDGYAGGVAILPFKIDRTGPRITGSTLQPGASVGTPAAIDLTFNEDMDAASLVNSVTLVEAGPDGIFDTGDDVPVTPTLIEYDTDTQTLLIDLDNGLAQGSYRLTLGDALATDIAGNALNGEWYGLFPTGNATAGGDFVMDFDVISTQVIGLTPTYDATASRTLNVEVTVNGALDPATLTEANIRLVNGGGGGEQVIPDELVYDADASLIRLVFTDGIPDGDYVLTVADEVLNVHGDALDGEFVPATGLPSGDGLAGGDFSVAFTIASPARVVSINPAPGESLENPGAVQITFSEPLLTDYIDADSFSVTGDGVDDILGTADDIIVNFTDILMTPDAKTVILILGGAMPEDTYHVMITPSRIPLSPSVVEFFSGGPADPALWQVNGDASFIGGYVQLTPNAVAMGGNMFYVPEIWTGAFRVMFDFYISAPPGRYGFVMGWAQTDDVTAQGDYTAEGGNMMGFDGIASNVYGVEFDMSGDSWAWDYNQSHVGLIEDTAANHLTWTAFTNPSDGAWHSADITVSGGVVRVLIDGVEKINYMLSDYEPFLGRLFFTAATATTTYSNMHAIDNLIIFTGTPDTLPGIRGTDGLLVDTEFSDGDSLPSGDGVPGGVFHSRFNADSIGPKVVAVSPESARLFREGYHPRVEITFNEDIGEEQATDISHYQVLHNFTDPVTINLVSYDPNNQTVTLVINDGQLLADGSYQITVFGDGPNAITDEAGNRLDGEFNGDDWPSGNDVEGGNFQYAFSVDSTRPRIVATNPTDGGMFSVGSIHTIQVYYSEDIPIVEATDRNNYRVRASGDDNSFKEGNEYYIRINYVTYDSINRIATIGLNDGFNLGDESYQLKIYNTTIHDLAGHVLDGNENLLTRDNFIMTFTVDTSHPEIIATDPSAAIEYVTDPNFDHIDLLFDEILLPVEATDPSSYTVRRSGNDGTFNDGNEITIAIDHVEWDAGSRIISVYLDPADLPEDTYQLVVQSGASATVQVTNVSPSAEIGSGVMALADGGWAVVDRAGDDLLLLDSRGTLLQTVNIGGSGGILPTALNLGNHVSQLPDGTFMLIDSANDWLIFIRPDGSLATEYGTAGGAVDGVIDVSFVQGESGIHAAATSYASGIAVIDNINDDLILLHASGTKIGVINIGGTSGLVPAASGLGGSMIELADGTLAITDVATGSIILVNPMTGQLVTDYGTGGIISVNAAVPEATTPQGLAEMPDGTIAVFDTAGNRIIFFNPNGSLDVTRGTGGILTPASADWAGVTGLTRTGSLYLADQTSQQIRVYRDNGAAGTVGIQDLVGNVMLSYFGLEFTFDNSGPVMIDANPAPGSNVREYVSMIEVWLNEELDPAPANDPANYEIRGWGVNGIFGDADDVIYDFTPHYYVDPSSGAVSVQLTLSAPLADGSYQVTLVGETSIYDKAGNHLNDGQNTQFIFTVDVLPGDFDLDGDVDGVDLGLWQTGYPTASGASLGDGDADGDGDVDGIDFGIWQANYPTNVEAAAIVMTTTPAPASEPVATSSVLDNQIVSPPAVSNELEELVSPPQRVRVGPLDSMAQDAQAAVASWLYHHRRGQRNAKSIHARSRFESAASGPTDRIVPTVQMPVQLSAEDEPLSVFEPLPKV